MHMNFIGPSVAFQFRCQSTVSSTARREDGFVSSGRVSISKKKDGILWSVRVQYRFRSDFMHFMPQGNAAENYMMPFISLFIYSACIYIEFSIHPRMISELFACSYLYLPTPHTNLTRISINILIATAFFLSWQQFY